MAQFVLPAALGALGLGASALGASSAASKQLKGTNQGIAANLAMFGLARKDLAPFRTGGAATFGKLQKLISSPFMKPVSKQMDGYFTNPITMDQATLESTPGYQFALSQGLKSVQNGYAARGLGSSGAAMKGAAQFATGLADQTYNTRFQQEMDQRNAIFDRMTQSQNNAFSRLYDTSALGESAAAGSAGNAMQTGSNIVQLAVGGANAQAGSAIYTGNAASNFFNDLGGYAYLKTLFKQ